MVGHAAGLVVGIRADCLVAAVCDSAEVKYRTFPACGVFFSKEKRVNCNGGKSETDLVRKGN